MRQLKTYMDTKAFYTAFQCQPDELHLVQSATFAQMIEAQQMKGYRAFTYLELLERALPKVYSIQGDIVLRAKIRNYLTKKNGDQFDRSFVEEYVKTFMFLFLCGPLALENGATHTLERNFSDIYQLLWQDEDIKAWRQEMQQMTKEQLAMRLKRPLFNKVIVHHFDFLDIPRIMLLNWLEDLGLEIVYYIPFREEQDQLFKVWKELYSPIKVGKNEAVLTQGQRWLSYVEHQKLPDCDDRVIKINSYQTPSDFKLHVQAIKKNEKWSHIAAYHNDDLNLFSSLVSDSSLRSTKQGMFFAALARCRWLGANDVYMEYPDFVKMLTSGWIHTSSAKGENAETLLTDLTPYMNGVTSLVEIGQRLNKLVELQEVSGEFDEVAKELTGRHIVKKYLSNPFRSLPYVHSDRYSITVKQLLECARELFRKLKIFLVQANQTVLLRDYMGRIKTVFDAVSTQWSAEVALEFNKIFDYAIPKDVEVQQEDIISYLTMLLSTKTKEYKRIISHDQIIGAVLQGGDMHITGLSLQTFPWKEPVLPGCLTTEWLERSIMDSFVTRRKQQMLEALKLDTLSRKLNQERAIYTLYHTFAYTEGNVTLSYIDGLSVNDTVSIYLKIIAQLYNTEVIEVATPLKVELPFAQTAPLERLSWPKVHLEQLPEVAWLDKDFCLKKFYLNHCVEAHPIYEGDLQQQFVFVIICRLLSEQADGEESVREFIFPLFPQWSEAHKENLFLRSFRQSLRQYKSYSNIYYPKAMSRLQRLFSSYEVTKRWRAREEYQKDTLEAQSHIKDIEKMGVQAEPGQHCMMCPFRHTCVEGGYSFDDGNS